VRKGRGIPPAAPGQTAGTVGWDEDMDPHCSADMKYLGGTGDYTVPWHHLELHRFGSVVEPKINCKKTRHNCHQNEVIWLVVWFTEGEGWFNKKG